MDPSNASVDRSEYSLFRVVSTETWLIRDGFDLKWSLYSWGWRSDDFGSESPIALVSTWYDILCGSDRVDYSVLYG